MSEKIGRVETWLPVRGWEELYEVSSEGRVKSLAREVQGKGGFPSWTPEKILRPTPRKPGYVYVTLSQKGVPVTSAVHRLVCEAFFGSPPEGAEVRHLNGVAYDNRSDNVVWGTPRENSADSLKHGVNHEANKTHCRAGHPYDEENTLWVSTPSGRGRQCKSCISARGRIRVTCLSCGASLARASFSSHKKKFHGGISDYTLQE